MAYPALVEKALRLIEERGGSVDEPALCRELFGRSGDWTTRWRSTT